MISKSRILIVDDEQSIRVAIGRALRLDGFEVVEVASGEAALAELESARFDAMILDVSMPGGMDGMQACRLLRKDGSDIPVLMLTALDAVDDCVAGLDAGADDYLVKPFALRELMARLRALLRRTEPDASSILQFERLTLNREKHTVEYDGTEIELSRTEFLLLETFLEHPRVVLTRSQIFNHVWGFDFGPASNSLNVYVGYLRRKLDAAGAPSLIHTVRGFGYVLRAEDDA